MNKFTLIFISLIGVLASNLYSQVAYQRQSVERNIRPNQVKRNAYLFINPIQQAPHQCQSTCASMILAYSGINLSPNDIEIATTGTTNATPPMSSIIYTLLKKFNIPMKMSRYEVKYATVDKIIEFAKELLDNNKPCYFLAYYHAIVIQGYDEGTRRIYCTDPTQPNNVIVFTYLDFMNFIRRSPEYKNTQKIFLGHINVDLINFFYLPKAPKEQSETFIYKGSLR